VFIIGMIVIPIVILRLDKASATPTWHYYIEPGIFTASEELNLNGSTYTLGTYMWRDFMPISPPDGKPLIAIIRVTALGLENFPSDVKIIRLWLIDGISIISTLATEENRVDGGILEMVFRGGPNWGPGTLVVVVKLTCFKCGTFYLKATDQVIHATF
jgi:hypothetical protein